jgi:hypothetical protein
VDPTWFPVVERAIQITTETFGSKKACARVSGVADLFGRIDKFPHRASRTSAFRRLDPDHLEEHEQPFARSGRAEEQEGGEPPPLAGAGVVVCLMG